MDLIVRMAKLSDTEEILKIYEPYVLNTAITFEITVPSLEEFKKRIENILKKYPFLVLTSENKIIGYAYATNFKSRDAFIHSAEVSIYLNQNYQGRGLGKKLYADLEGILKKQNVTNLYALVAHSRYNSLYLNNKSELFHEKMGYKTVGNLGKCGYKFNEWYDLLYMEKIINDHKKINDFKKITEIR